MILFILLSMIFCHIVDDFYLQGILAQLKQKQWWKDNYPNKMYESDWIISLIIHSFSWSFMTMLPIAIYYIVYNMDNWNTYFVFVIMNVVGHAIIDHIKANKLQISLTTDQLLHLIQITTTWLVLLKTQNI